MAYGPREKRSNLAALISQAGEYGLSNNHAIEIVTRICDTITGPLDAVLDQAGLEGSDRMVVAANFLHPATTDGLGKSR